MSSCNKFITLSAEHFKGGEYIGPELVTDGEVTITEGLGNIYINRISVGRSLTILKGVNLTVRGDIIAEGSVITEDGVTAGGSIVSGGMINVGGSLKVRDLIVNGDVITRSIMTSGRADINGNVVVYVDDFINGGGLVVHGSVRCHGHFRSDKSVEVSGNFIVDRCIKAGLSLSVGGVVICGGNIDCLWNFIHRKSVTAQNINVVRAVAGNGDITVIGGIIADELSLLDGGVKASWIICDGSISACFLDISGEIRAGVNTNQITDDSICIKELRSGTIVSGTLHVVQQITR